MFRRESVGRLVHLGISRDMITQTVSIQQDIQRTAGVIERSSTTKAEGKGDTDILSSGKPVRPERWRSLGDL